MVDIIIEIPKNSRIKYEKDESSNNIRCDRYLKTPFSYPYNYGYVPNTLAPDNDPLDVFLLIDEPLYPGTIILVDIIGVFKMIDDNESDDKLIAIPSKKLNFPEKYTFLENGKTYVKKVYLDEIRFFLENYKKMENKKVIIEKYLEKEEAMKILTKYQLNL
tara:strand:+ start:2777 stop:3259 length:483 start_codon:yes stop_codon:yes gene_type:complete